MPRRDPPASNLSRNEIFTHLQYDYTENSNRNQSPPRTSISDFYARMAREDKDPVLVDEIRVKESKDKALNQVDDETDIESVLRRIETNERLRYLQRGQRGVSVGEQGALKKDRREGDSIGDGTASTFALEVDEDDDDDNINKAQTQANADGSTFALEVDEDDDDDNINKAQTQANADGCCSPPQILVAGFFRTLFEFLTCAAITNMCCHSKTVESEDVPIVVEEKVAEALEAEEAGSTTTPPPLPKKLDYEMPLTSAQDIDDIGAWGNGSTSKEQEIAGHSPKLIAKAMHFSSKRLDDERPAFALYDHMDVHEPLHMGGIPDYYYGEHREGAAAEEEAYDDFTFGDDETSIPDAIIVRPRRIDDVSILEVNSVDSLEDLRMQAWSAPPRRKRRLKAQAIAVDTTRKCDP